MRKLASNIFIQSAGAALLIIIIISVLAYPRSRGANIGNSSNSELDVSQLSPSQRAERYLLDNFQTIKPEQRLILDYLQRKYQLNERFSASISPINNPPFDPEYAVPLDGLRRIAYPDQRVTNLKVSDSDPITKLLAVAANCDIISPSSDYPVFIQQSISSGGYRLSHVLFALQLIEENDCNVLPDLGNLRSQALTATASLIENPETVADLRYEAVAFVAAFNPEEVKSNKVAIDQIIKEQKPEGGWSEEVATESISDHATVLALWALLEAERPEEAEPILRR